jgi:hypothetical protein
MVSQPSDLKFFKDWKMDKKDSQAIMKIFKEAA